MLCSARSCFVLFYYVQIALALLRRLPRVASVVFRDRIVLCCCVSCCIGLFRFAVFRFGRVRLSCCELFDMLFALISVHSHRVVLHCCVLRCVVCFGLSYIMLYGFVLQGVVLFAFA